MKEIVLTDQQLSAVEMVKKNKISLLVGGPGCGKTTTTLEIMNWAKSENLNILQTAPTGKAAKRMMQATGEYASTIHSMLGCIFEDGEFLFAHNKDFPLDADLIILDEISMITNDLMARVMDAVDVRRTRVLLVGDQDQLPSVGAGAVLRDLLASGVIPHTELDIIHRNSGEIVSACHKIKKGQGYVPYNKLDLEAESPINLIHIECFTPEQALVGIQRLVCDVIPEKYGYDPIDEIQVISPVNSKGPLSCDSINAVLQDKLNPTSKVKDVFGEDEKKSDSQKIKFRPGDKVINTKNSKAKTVSGEETGIVNGDIGIVKDVTNKIITVEFADPDREVEILRKEHKLLHAYCITCHRFQGSEAPVIIIPVHTQFNYFLSNPWIYTAISRAKVICVTIGTFGTVEYAIRNRIPNNRTTKLKERIVAAEHAAMELEFAEI